jgi:acyl-CoA synthetase (AMP-forming)/AMP-acid ligase II
MYIVDEIPKGPTGKILQSKLQEKIAWGKAITFKL